MEIYPSLLEQSADDLFAYIHNTEHLFSHYQIDVTDNTYTKSSTITPRDIQEYLETHHHHSPAHTTFEFHLMVEHFDSYIEDLKLISAHLPITHLIVHLEPAIRWTRGSDEALHESLHDSFPFQFGLALSPEIDPAEHYHTLSPFHSIQIMTVKPGLQGQDFIPESLNKVEQLRQLGFTGRVTIDGGVDDTTLPLISQLSHLPDAVCPGSYLRTHTEKHLKNLYRILGEENLFTSS